MSKRILVVEDEDLVGTMVRLNLESAGYQVVWVRNGDEAAEQAAVEPFDLILLDISLPGMGGLSVLEKLRSLGVGTPIMMLTARADVPTKVRALDFGADDYLAKPFHVEEMLARVNALVRRSQAERTMPADHIVQVGDHQVNLETRRAHTEDGEVTLSEKEAALVKLLLRSSRRAFVSIPSGRHPGPGVAGDITGRERGATRGAGPRGPSPSGRRGPRRPRRDGAPRAPAAGRSILVLHRPRLVRGRGRRDPRAVRGAGLPRDAIFVAQGGAGPSLEGSPAS
ncbi:MAG: response regulator transcription factor [Spirochaetia bacterium]